MSLLEGLLAAVTLLSFGLAILSHMKSERVRLTEAGNISLMKEKLGALHHGLLPLVHTADAMVQIPKSREVGAEELQVLARIVRGQGFVLLKEIDSYRSELSEWRFGVMIQSTPAEDSAVEAVEES